MRRLLIRFLSVSVPPAALLLMFVLCTHSGSAQSRSLLVPQYPGSVAEEYPPEPEGSMKVSLPSRMQVFFSKDQPAKALAFYEKKVAKYEETYETNVGSYGAVVSPDEVNQFLVRNKVGTKGEAQDDYTHGVRAGVTVYGKPQTYNMNVHHALDALRAAYLLRFNTGEEPVGPLTERLNDPEFTKVLAKYEHLEWEQFMTVKGRKVDDAIYEKHYTIPQKEDQEELSGLTKKMQDLMAAGKYDEATKAGDRMMVISARPTDAKHNWDVAIACLDEFAANAFPTRIVIDRPLAEWDLSKVPREK